MSSLRDEIDKLAASKKMTNKECGALLDVVMLLDEISGIPGDRLREIAAAEREGRVVVLPCKVGSDVWLVLPDYTECSAHGEKYSEYSCAGCESECDSKQTQTIKRHKNVSLLSLGGWIASKCFGKTVFLTRAEAEAALAEKGAEE